MAAALKKSLTSKSLSALPVERTDSGKNSPKTRSPRHSGKAKSPRHSQNSHSAHNGHHGHHAFDPEHDMESMQEVTERLEAKIGVIQISGRYHRHPKCIESDYMLTDTVLGSGYNGEVRMATSKERPEHKFAIKAFNFAGVPAQRKVQLESEIECFLSMDHPHIARLVDVYEKDYHMDLVMECMQGGELLDRVRVQKRFGEKETANLVWQMLLALNYIHSHNMIHCDLKLENFMFDNVDSDHLKLIDFGFSKMCSKNAELRRKACGTLSYTAPEVLDWSYTQHCDQWSLGVIVFVMLAGYMPFSGTEAEQMSKISAGTYVMKQERWGTISEEAKNFTTSLLQVDPKKRLTAETALLHPFIRDRHFDDKTQVDVGIVKALRDYGHQSRFRRCCMSLMAWSLSQEERAQVEDYFLAMDANHQGAITYDELKKVMVDKFHLPQGEAKRSFQALDPNHNKEIHYSDFLAAMVGTRVELHDELVHEAFRKFDTDNCGYITANNLREVLGDVFEGQKVEKMLNEADTLHQGMLSYHEFASYLTGRQVHRHGDEAIGYSMADPAVDVRGRGHSCKGNVAQPCCSVQ